MSEDVPPYHPRAGTGADPDIEKAQEAMRNQLEAQQQLAVLSAGVMVLSMTSTSSAKFDAFATWLLTGFGAAVALLLSNHDAAALVSPAAVRFGAQLFIGSVVVVVIEKYLAIALTGSAEAASAARTAMKEYLDLSKSLNLGAFASEFTPQFRHAFGHRDLKTATGDASAMRGTQIVAGIQASLVLLQIVLFLVALIRIVGSVPGSR